jgi:hypothetical protein
MYEYYGIQALVYNFARSFLLYITLMNSMRDSSAPKNSATKVLLYIHWLIILRDTVRYKSKD